MNDLLAVSGLKAWYGHSQALFDVNFSLGSGEVLALMGRNGMGKSTTIKSLCRMMPKWEGSISFDGHDLERLPSHKAARLGLGLVPEGRRCFVDLTVFENCAAAARPGEWNFSRVCDLFPRLQERRDQVAGTLSGGEQQMLAIARALTTNPKLLLLDEATEGLAPTVRAEIWTAITQLKETGLSIILVDKSFNEIISVADKCIILENGRVAWSGLPDDLQSIDHHRLLGV